MLLLALTPFSRFLFSKRTERTKTAGKTQPASTPIFKLSFAACVTSPTMPGPTAPPRSPAIARKANIAVPPSGTFFGSNTDCAWPHDADRKAA